uniref:Polysaccharide deacetylase n=1 Tax=Marseillevirus LCMAC103 TaxID=2506604 RepID=A0A481YV49_9VIRU|nr:MAG: polysaccharide deacetylase [Marseillevirus LCMAC103]
MFSLAQLVGAFGLAALGGYVLTSPLLRMVSRVFPWALTHIATKKKIVALSIDDAPYGESFDKILDALARHDVKVTFFVISGLIGGREEALKRAIREGHKLENHGSTNSMLALKPRAIVKTEITECDRKLRELGAAPKFFRPGCGVPTPYMNTCCSGLGLKVALASNYPHDPLVTSPLVNFWNIRLNLAPGDCIVIHDRSRTVELLDKLIPYLKSQQYQIVTVDRLFG